MVCVNDGMIFFSGSHILDRGAYDGEIGKIVFDGFILFRNPLRVIHLDTAVLVKKHDMGKVVLSKSFSQCNILGFGNA